VSSITADLARVSGPVALLLIAALGVRETAMFLGFVIPFLFYNALGGIIWGAGYCLLGYAAGPAYAAIERQVGTGVAVVLAVLVVAAVVFWVIRRHRRGRLAWSATRSFRPWPRRTSPRQTRPCQMR
jgi:hypothetical protein